MYCARFAFVNSRMVPAPEHILQGRLTNSSAVHQLNAPPACALRLACCSEAGRGLLLSPRSASCLLGSGPFYSSHRLPRAVF